MSNKSYEFLGDNPERCSTIYGPVKSRRHGVSLGVHTGDPENKICTWGCVYCQCGMGARAETPKESYPSAEKILSLFKDAVKTSGHLDTVTFAGSSEPSAHPEFLKIVQGMIAIRKEMGAKWIINILSNGSELEREDAIEALNLIDEAWMKLDCAVEDEFRRLNRPLARVGKIEDHLARMSRLKTLRIQTLFFTADDPKLSNWDQANRGAMADAFLKIKPKEIHISTIARQPAVDRLKPIALAELEAYGASLRAKGLDVKVFGA